MKKRSKNEIETNRQIDIIRKKFGKPPLGSQKTYKQRLEEYNKRNEKKYGKFK